MLIVDLRRVLGTIYMGSCMAVKSIISSYDDPEVEQAKRCRFLWSFDTIRTVPAIHA